MIVTRDNFRVVLETLKTKPRLSIDTETTGLRPYHGSKLFSIAISDELNDYYFNFIPYAKLYLFDILAPSHKVLLQEELLSRTDITWFLHNAAYDLAILNNDNLFIHGEIHDTLALARIEYNNHMSYSLDSCAERIGLKKDKTVEEYIKKNKLWTNNTYTDEKDKHYDQVPFEIISKYAKIDARVTYQLGVHQLKKFNTLSEATSKLGVPSILDVMENEKKLTKTLHNMVKHGILVDIEYCKRASIYEMGREKVAQDKFKELTGEDYRASPKLFAKIFESEKHKWVYTPPTKTAPNGNPSFTYEIICTFDNPVAKVILEIRDAKSRSDFYNGFIYHADTNGYVHPNLNQAGTVTGRLSSSNPNMQNTSSEEGVELEKEFVIRRAIVAPPNHKVVSLDYSAMEYRICLDLASKMRGRMIPLAKQVLDGTDVHQATADIASTKSLPVTRKQAKTVNFLTIYGGGKQKLAQGLGVSVNEAVRIQQTIFKAIPEVKQLINAINSTAEVRGYLFGFSGRRWFFPDKNFCYKATNALVQGSCGDVAKKALNDTMDYLKDKKSKLVLTVHDEQILYVHNDELSFVPLAVKLIMINSYKHNFLPMDVSICVGDNLADLEDYK